VVRDLLFVDEARVLSFLAQAQGPTHSAHLTASLKLPFGTGLEWSPPTTEGPRKVDAELDTLMSLLRDHEQLSAVRPASLSLRPDRSDPILVHEVVTATRVLLPLPEWVPGGPKALTIWVADPDISQEFLSPANHNLAPIFDTAFLFLLQEHWPDGPAQPMISGCSALQLVANIAAQKPENEPDTPEWPHVDLGRMNPQHPVAKLAEIGGLVLGSRRIETLYRVRYISNEQSYCYLPERQDGASPLDWTWLRVHDVAAYPLFVAALA
jgi:hypothetical protein